MGLVHTIKSLLFRIQDDGICESAMPVKEFEDMLDEIDKDFYVTIKEEVQSETNDELPSTPEGND